MYTFGKSMVDFATKQFAAKTVCGYRLPRAEEIERAVPLF